MKLKLMALLPFFIYVLIALFTGSQIGESAERIESSADRIERQLQEALGK